MKAPPTTTTNNKICVEKATEAAVPPPKRQVPTNLPFQIKDLHKKALLVLLHRHHANIFLTYSQLSQEIGVGEKTKNWQCEAWKNLKKNEYIVSGPEKRTFCLSPRGVELASCFASDEELADFLPPVTNEALHEKIRKRLRKDKHKGNKHKGVEIFDKMLVLCASPQGAPKTRLELAFEVGCNPDSHGFFYGFRALQRMGLVKEAGNVTRDELIGKHECLFRKNEGDEPKDDEYKKLEVESEESNEEESNEKDEGDGEDSETGDGSKVTRKNNESNEESKEEDCKDKDEASGAATPTQQKSDRDGIQKKKKRQSPTEQGLQTKKRRMAKKGKVRVRGGKQLFVLSEKAFLTTTTTAPAPVENQEMEGATE